MLIEADRRGLLTGRRKEEFDEAVNRGLITLPEAPPSSDAERRFLRVPLVPGVARVSGVGQPTDPDRSGFRAGSRAALTRVVNSAAGIPELILDVEAMLREPGFPTEQFDEDTLGLPSGEQLVSGAETAAEVPARFLSGDNIDLSEMFGKNLADARMLAAENPGATDVGETVGDIATLLTGRAPIARARAPARRAQREAVEREAQRRLDLIPDDIKSQLNDVVTENVLPFFRESSRNIARGSGKVVGTGIEGATLAAINDGDVSTTFGVAAGGQAVGSASLFLVEKPLKRLLPFVATAFVASEMFKAAAPGEQSFFESKDFAIQKTVGAFALGLTSALAGAGRLRGARAEQFPVVFDAITATPRGALLSRLQELTNESNQGNDLPLRVMEQFARNPDSFNQTQQADLGRALQSPDKGAFSSAVEKLMKTENFRSRLIGSQ